VKRCAGAGRFNRRIACDEVQSAAFALGAQAAEPRLRLFCQQGAWIRCGSGREMESAENQRLTPVAVGKQPEVANLDETGGGGHGAESGG
jgi:hypothetical protein